MGRGNKTNLPNISFSFAIWNGTFNMLSNFISIVNNINPHINITHSADNAFCIFLDLHLYKLNNQLCHKIHFKNTNSHSILHPSSNHAKHIFKGIIFSQIRRCPSLCSLREDFKCACNEIFPIYNKRGYSRIY